MKDFEEMSAAAREKGLKIIMDFVPNHSSDRHEWFVRSEGGEEPYTDYYVWADPAGWEGDTPLPPNNWLSKVRSSAWSWRASATPSPGRAAAWRRSQTRPRPRTATASSLTGVSSKKPW